MADVKAEQFGFFWWINWIIRILLWLLTIAIVIWFILRIFGWC
ncbi:MAG TPA: hypothetical protein PKM09_03635 [Bacillota bacterium]|nr:MAG: hypothetical protein BWY92_01269 [Firmicutes bacterium ADurb.BinA052]HNU93633.1 hypothetical protein [Bacillota bacterium]HNY67791.1 hypothetical protein [Bacillota bacterium]